MLHTSITNGMKDVCSYKVHNGTAAVTRYRLTDLKRCAVIEFRSLHTTLTRCSTRAFVYNRRRHRFLFEEKRRVFFLYIYNIFIIYSVIEVWSSSTRYGISFPIQENKQITLREIFVYGRNAESSSIPVVKFENVRGFAFFSRSVCVCVCLPYTQIQNDFMITCV